VNSVLQVHSLAGGYTRPPVLSDVDFGVVPDEIVAVLGANGAGKTTRLRALSETPDLSREVRLGVR
jgi:ABC-type branched-subunit amino acid transport system ATPase component